MITAAFAPINTVFCLHSGIAATGHEWRSEFLRHKCIQTAVRYAHLAKENAPRAVAEIRSW